MLAAAVFEIKPTIQACKGVEADFEKLEKMAAIFANPATFVYHVGKDLVLNGKDIYKEVNDSITQYNSKNWDAFGYDIGEALAKLILGEAQELQREYETMEEIDFWRPINSACLIDEAQNTMGKNRCTSDNECAGQRTCSYAGWCHGESFC